MAVANYFHPFATGTLWMQWLGIEFNSNASLPFSFYDCCQGEGHGLEGFHILLSAQELLVFSFLLLVLPSDKTWHAQCSPYPSHTRRCGLAEDSGPVFLWRWVEAAIWTSRRRLVARSSKALERKRKFCALWFKLAPVFLAVPCNLVLKL